MQVDEMEYKITITDLQKRLPIVESECAAMKQQLGMLVCTVTENKNTVDKLVTSDAVRNEQFKAMDAKLSTAATESLKTNEKLNSIFSLGNKVWYAVIIAIIGALTSITVNRALKNPSHMMQQTAPTQQSAPAETTTNQTQQPLPK